MLYPHEVAEVGAGPSNTAIETDHNRTFPLKGHAIKTPAKKEMASGSRR